MTDCLSEADLNRLHGGELDIAERARVFKHLDMCGDCSRRNAALIAEQEVLQHQIRGLVLEETVDFSLPAVGRASDVRPASSSSLAIAGYEVLRELHRGGQGVVYQAVQTSTKRKVAVKVLLEGQYASEKTKRRFEREIELAASLKHPNIISIFDSGQTPEGHQFCVMDYIRGVPLNQYVRDKRLTLEQALKLFGSVCEAVNHAHQKGIIHRDLKPSNILVDSDGNAKVLDFGLAKLLGGPEQTLVSMTGQVVGTLPYMSPEQTLGNPDQVDTRTDVYALGVILYEMLTGHYPYPVVGQMADVVRHIVETEPTPPGRNWSRVLGVSRSSAKVRAGQCPIDGEVQTIVLKALAKEKGRRYATVALFHEDIVRYLSGLPILARPTGPLSRASKFVRRHRVGFATTLTTAVLLVSLSWLLYVGSAKEARRRDENIRRMVDDAAIRRRDLDFGGARKLLQSALAQSKNKSVDAFVELALTLVREAAHEKKPQLLDEAIASAKQAITLEASHFDAWSVLCVAQRDAQDYDEAIATCQRAIEIAKGTASFSAFINLGRAYLGRARDRHDLLAAQRNFEIGTRMSPVNSGLIGWYNLAAIERALGNVEAAASALEQSNDLYTRFPRYTGDHKARIRMLEALMLIERGDKDSLAAAADKVTIAKDGFDEPSSRLTRIEALISLRQGRMQDAIQLATAALSIDDTEFIYCHLILALANAKLGDRALARKQMDAIAQVWPSDEFIVHRDGSQFVWIDTKRELEELRSEALQLLD